MVTFSVDAKGFIWADGVKLPMKLVIIGASPCLEFVIKDPRIAEIHGTRYLRVPISNLSVLNGEQP